MRMVDILRKKREGMPLTTEEMQWVLAGCMDQSIPDYQVSALLMAIFFQGMEEEELAAFTKLMADTGTTLDTSRIAARTVDKHSTGGVGDKTTFILNAMVAAAGGYVAKMSGRGLGHTGGTIDKLASIPGVRTELTTDELIDIVSRVGCAITSQSKDMAPVDKILYALRDVTGSVESLPLIASSVMSKKLACGAQGLVLDVKMGSGAFMKKWEDAERLAKTMVDIGERNGRHTIAVITSMEEPLGNTIGNGLEIQEVIETLQGRGPQDLAEECIELAATMLLASGIEEDIPACRKRAAATIWDGTAWQRFQDMVAAQGGDVSVLQEPERLVQARYTRDILADTDGFLVQLDAEGCGRAAVVLGAGRQTKEDSIDPSAGIRLYVKCGDRVAAGEVMATLYTNEEVSLEEAERLYRGAVRIGTERPMLTGRVLAQITKDGVRRA